MTTTKAPLHDLVHKLTVQEAGGVFSILVEILIIVVNILPIIVVTKWKNIRTRSCMDDLIVMISVFDMICVTIPTPIVHVSYFNKTWVGGMMTCGFYQIMTTWLRMCSLFALTTISVDKSFSTHLFLSSKRLTLRTGRFKIVLFTFTVVLFSLMISSLPIIGLGPNIDDSSLCILWIISKPSSHKEYVFVISFVSFGLFNLICIGISNTYILCKRKQIKSLMYGRNQGDHHINVRVQLDGSNFLQGGKLVSAISLVVYITWLPNMVLIVLKTIGVNISDISILYSMLSTSLPGLLNPILYGLCDSSYRRGYKRIFQSIRSCCHCNEQRRQDIPSVVLNTTVQRSTSESAELSRNDERQGIPHSASRMSAASGVYNSAFAETSVSNTAFTRPNQSTLVQELKNQPIETTRLLSSNDVENSSYFESENIEIDEDDESTSSMMSSDESYEDLRSQHSSDEYEADFRESIM